MHIPLTEQISRIMLAKRAGHAEEKLSTPNLVELEHLASVLTQVPVKLVNPVWISQFRLHHRGVTKYYTKPCFPCRGCSTHS